MLVFYSYSDDFYFFASSLQLFNCIFCWLSALFDMIKCLSQVWCKVCFLFLFQSLFHLLVFRKLVLHFVAPDLPDEKGAEDNAVSDSHNSFFSLFSPLVMSPFSFLIRAVLMLQLLVLTYSFYSFCVRPSLFHFFLFLISSSSYHYSPSPTPLFFFFHAPSFFFLLVGCIISFYFLITLLPIFIISFLVFILFITFLILHSSLKHSLLEYFY